MLLAQGKTEHNGIIISEEICISAWRPCAPSLVFTVPSHSIFVIFNFNKIPSENDITSTLQHHLINKRIHSKEEWIEIGWTSQESHNWMTRCSMFNTRYIECKCVEYVLTRPNNIFRRRKWWNRWRNWNQMRTYGFVYILCGWWVSKAFPKIKHSNTFWWKSKYKRKFSFVHLVLAGWLVNWM